MSKLGPLAKQLTTAADAPLVQLLERLVTAEVKGPYARLLVARLTGAALKVVESSVKAAERLLMLTGEIFVAGKVVAQRRTSFAHLFGDGLKQARADPARASYLRLADQMNELLGTTAGRDALKSDAVRKSAEALRNQLTENVGFGVFDRYEDLRHETSALNHLNRVLTPDDYPGGIRFDAHHLVEDRTYQKFAAEWKLIGWQKPEDMMATAIPWESHIRSSASKKGLAGFEERPEALLSLTKRLQDAIPLDKYSLSLIHI